MLNACDAWVLILQQEHLGELETQCGCRLGFLAFLKVYSEWLPVVAKTMGQDVCQTLSFLVAVQ